MATDELVTVNAAAVSAAREAELVVIFPHVALIVTAVVRFVA
jgi:hypothetical protein